MHCCNINKSRRGGFFSVHLVGERRTNETNKETNKETIKQTNREAGKQTNKCGRYKLPALRQIHIMSEQLVHSCMNDRTTAPSSHTL